MEKYKGGTHLKWWVIFFVLVSLVSFLKFSVAHSKNVLIEEDDGGENYFIEDEFDNEELQNNVLRQCDPPAEQPYNRAWDLSIWLRNNASLESSLRSFKTAQAGIVDPVPFDGKHWKKEVRQLRKVWGTFLGPIPRKKCVSLDPRQESLDLNDKELALVNTSSYRMTKVSYRGAHGERIPAFLLVPNKIKKGGKLPAVLVMHQSLAVCGKKEPVGVCLEGTPWLDFAKDLAEKGFITLAPDSIGYGERSEYFNYYGLEYADAAPLLSRFPSSTLMGLRISDVMRGIDFLKILPYVDDKRLGMIGHSNGGIETLFNAAFDKRIKCAVSNAGANLIRREILGWWGWNPGIARWAGGGYIPALGFFNNDIKNLPVETHQLYAMIAPRGLFISLMEDDTLAPKFDRIQFSMDQTKRVFDALGGDFAYHTITTGLTPENRAEWAAPMSMAENYDACVAKGDTACLNAFVRVGITATCITDKGHVQYCAHDVWKECMDMYASESRCISYFSETGITAASIEDAFQKYLRRDHGWYPETEAEAYPWLEECLKK